MALSGLLLAPLLTLLATSPASAAPVTDTIDDISYAADDADPAAGATVTGYSGPGGAVTIPDTVDIAGITYDVVTVDISAFRGAGLTSVVVGENVKTIEPWAFEDNQITTLSLPAGLETIEMYAFENNLLTSIDLPAGVSVGYSAFIDNEIASLALPEGFEFPPPGTDTAQFENNQIASLVLPDSVTYIPHYAFRNNLLTHVVIPASVTRIGEQAFRDNPLQTVDFLGDAPQLDGDRWFPGADITYRCEFDVAHGGAFSSPIWNDGDENHPSSAHPVTMTFHHGHGVDVVQQVPCNAAIPEPAAPTADGYEFIGWTLGGDRFNFADSVAVVDLTFVAQWEPASAGGGTTGGGTGIGSVASSTGTAVTSPGVLPATGASAATSTAALLAVVLVFAGCAVLYHGRQPRNIE